MLLIPAIDLKDGKCVRLRQGRMDDETVFYRGFYRSLYSTIIIVCKGKNNKGRYLFFLAIQYIVVPSRALEGSKERRIQKKMVPGHRADVAQ